jgi:acyl-CoA synthetase (AMP-forming)/AMP-acid ligase II
MIDVRNAMRRAAAFHRDRLAVVSGERRLTYAEAWSRGLRFANALMAHGIAAGDRVAVLEDNCLEASDFFLGTAAANVVRVPLYRRNSREAHGHMLRNTQCKALVVSEEYAHEVEGLQQQMPTLEHVIVRRGDYESWLAKYPDSDPDPAISLDDYYVIRHSGGTTGTPKGMVFSHRAWMNTERDWTYLLPPIEAGDACVHAGPISHGSGYLFVPLWLAGGRSILESKFVATRILDLLDQHGGYHFAVPTMIIDLLAAAQDRKRSFAKLKAIVVSGAPIRAQTALAARELFGPRLHQLYGQTECVPVAWMGPNDWFGQVAGSEPLAAVGRVMPFAEIDIRDDHNRSLPVGEIGEIAVRADGQMQKIWNEPQQTAERVIDGWVLTRDVGRLDANGFLYLVDRKDDMIISGGFNIWPAELEIVIAALPGVREVAVVGAPFERWGERPIAVVVVQEGAPVTAQQVIDACADKLGSYKKPAQVILQQEPLPRTPVGKIQRKAVRERFWAGRTDRIGGT